MLIGGCSPTIREPDELMDSCREQRARQMLYIEGPALYLGLTVICESKTGYQFLHLRRFILIKVSLTYLPDTRRRMKFENRHCYENTTDRFKFVSRSRYSVEFNL